MIKEYRFRFGDKPHKGASAFYVLADVFGELPNTCTLDADCEIQFLQVMPDEFKTPGDGVEAYKNYYKYKYTEGFKRPMRWTKRAKPDWLGTKPAWL
jgi:hypothetical protein